MAIKRARSARSDTNRRCSSCAANWIASRRLPRRSRRIAIMPSARSHGFAGNPTGTGGLASAMRQPFRPKPSKLFNRRFERFLHPRPTSHETEELEDLTGHYSEDVFRLFLLLSLACTDIFFLSSSF